MSRPVVVLGVLLVVVAAPLPGWLGAQDLASGRRDAARSDDVSSGVAVPFAGPLDAPARGLATHPGLLTEQPAAPAPPVRIELPTLGVTAPVAAVGVDPDGELDVPPSASVAGWYLAGPAPTATAGSAVIAAHVDHDGEQGVFFRLSELRPGDPVTVTSADGLSTSFTVVSTTSYAKADLPGGEMFRRVGDPVLTLITCGGEFRRDRRSYADNVVVRATATPG